VVVLTGTLGNRSVLEFGHLCELALGEGSPLAREEMVLRDWAFALDEKVPDFQRKAPGALLRWGDSADTDLVAARRAFKSRFSETPGVVCTDDTFTDVLLHIRCFDVNYSPRAASAREIECLPCGGLGCKRCRGRGFHAFAGGVDGAFAQLRTLQQTLDGVPVPDASAVWRHAREYACGFYYRLDPPPPRRWVEARTACFAFVQDVLMHGRQGLASMGDVFRAHPTDPRIVRWQQIRGEYDPDRHRQAVWFDDTIIRLAAKWAAEAPGLVWTEHTAFGERLERETGLPYCREGGADALGVQATAQNRQRSVICSVSSIGEGHNMQPWHRNLVISCPPNGNRWEQLISRTHRPGQTRPVSVEVLTSCIETLKGFRQAVADCEMQEQTRGQAQKLLIAGIEWPKEGDGSRWVT